MKKNLSTAIVLMALCGAGACSDSTGGKSTPIEQTKENGAAPVQQTEGTPTTTIDTTMQQHTDQIKTGQDMQRIDTSTMPPHASAGSGASNTTDKRTTSGSANDGKAGKK